MSVIIGTLFCVGLEMMLDFNLIPNNFRYKKIFKNSLKIVRIINILWTIYSKLEK